VTFVLTVDDVRALCNQHVPLSVRASSHLSASRDSPGACCGSAGARGAPLRHVVAVGAIH